MHFSLVFEDLAQVQRQDQQLSNIIQRLERKEICNPYFLSKRLLHCRAPLNGKPKIVVPTAAIPIIFDYFHVSPFGGHLGIFKTIDFVWSGMGEDIHTRERNRRICALSKPAQNSRLELLASEMA
jgi:hypothetical protein